MARQIFRAPIISLPLPFSSPNLHCPENSSASKLYSSADMNGVEAHSWKRVVVVGGGVAGALISKSLQFDADVVLIDPKEYLEIPWANMKSKVEPTIAEQAIIRHTEYLVNGKIITSTAVNVSQEEVITEDGRQVTYDYLVIATGHAVPSAMRKSERLEQFQEENMKIRSSSSILIIGGGTTGVELASEIAVAFPDKMVRIVHSGPRLLQSIGQKSAKKALDWLRSKKVEVLLDQSIDLSSYADKVYTTSAGVTIIADCHFVCVDRALGSSWLENSILKDCLDKNSRLRVDENLRVGGRSNIFAIGDITDIPELKQGYNSQRHAIILAKNLKVLLKGFKENKLCKYRPTSAATVRILGTSDTVAQLPYLTMFGCAVGAVNPSDLFLRRTRKLMGLDRHSSLVDIH